MKPMGHPVDFPSKTPDKNSTSSFSCREVVMSDCPGRRRFSSACTKSMSMVMPAGNPSMTPPMPFPCDSPKLVRRRMFPNELNIIRCFKCFIVRIFLAKPVKASLFIPKNSHLFPNKQTAGGKIMKVSFRQHARM